MEIAKEALGSTLISWWQQVSRACFSASAVHVCFATWNSPGGLSFPPGREHCTFLLPCCFWNDAQDTEALKGFPSWFLFHHRTRCAARVPCVSPGRMCMCCAITHITNRERSNALPNSSVPAASQVLLAAGQQENRSLRVHQCTVMEK